MLNLQVSSLKYAIRRDGPEGARIGTDSTRIKGETMFGTSAIRLACLLALGPVVATGLSAQGKTDSSEAGDTSETYATLDGYGLGKIVPGSISDVTARARTAMIRMKIVEDPGRPLSGRWRVLRGKRGLSDVVIRLRSQSSSTSRVEVTARRGAADYEKGLAQQVIDEIEKTR